MGRNAVRCLQGSDGIIGPEHERRNIHQINFLFLHDAYLAHQKNLTSAHKKCYGINLAMTEDKKITIPTLITLTRFILAPIFITLFTREKYLASVLILCLAGFTDLLDGFIARRFHMRSKLGSMLDPLADKFLMLVSFIFLSSQNRIPWNLTLLVIGRDIGIVLGAVILNLIHVKLYYRPTLLSKLNTASQILVLVFSFGLVFLTENPPSFLPDQVAQMLSKFQHLLVLTTILLTIVTALQYAYIAIKFYRFGERSQ